MKIEKSKLFRDTNIRVYWIDSISKKEKSGILWDIVWVDSAMSANPNNDKLVDVKLYEWTVFGDDKHYYTLPETELYLDSKEKLSN